MIENNIKKNKFAYSTIKNVKENIIKSKEPLHNPIVLNGLNKALRYRIFWSIFDKEFNQKYKGIYMYSACDKLTLAKLKSKKLVIVENIELLIKNETLQNKMKELLKIYFEQKIQVILCSDRDIKSLEINELIKSKMQYGLILYLK